MQFKKLSLSCVSALAMLFAFAGRANAADLPDVLYVIEGISAYAENVTPSADDLKLTLNTETGRYEGLIQDWEKRKGNSQAYSYNGVAFYGIGDDGVIFYGCDKKPNSFEPINFRAEGQTLSYDMVETTDAATLRAWYLNYNLPYESYNVLVSVDLVNMVAYFTWTNEIIPSPEILDYTLSIEGKTLSRDNAELTEVEPGFTTIGIAPVDPEAVITVSPDDEYGNSALQFIYIYGIDDPERMTVAGVERFEDGMLYLYDEFEAVGDYVIAVDEGVFLINDKPAPATTFYFTTGKAEVIPTTVYINGAFNDYAEPGLSEWQLPETGEGTMIYEGTFEVPEGRFEFNLRTNEGMIYIFAGEGQAPEGSDQEGEEERPGVMILPVSFTDGIYSGNMSMAIGGEENYFWAYPSWAGGSITVTANLEYNTITIAARENEKPVIPEVDRIVVSDVTLNLPSYDALWSMSEAVITVGESLDMAVVLYDKEDEVVENEEVVWESNVEGVECLFNDGIYTIITDGAIIETPTPVTLTGTVGDAQAAHYSFTLKPVLRGDANGNGQVSVADVVTTANYAVATMFGNVTKEDLEGYIIRMVFPNADLNHDNRINVQDVNMIVGIIQEQYETMRVRGRSADSVNTNDRLVADNFTVILNQEFNIGVRLENTYNYSSIQGSVEIPDGMTLVNVTKGIRAEGHSLVYRVFDNRVNIMLYSNSNTAFPEGDGELFNLVVTATEDAGNLRIENIEASDAAYNGYILGFAGGINQSQTTGISALGSEEGNGVRYFTVSGTEILNPEAGQIVIRLENGKAEKVIK